MNVRLRGPLDVISGRVLDVRWVHPLDDQVGSLGEVLRTLEEEVLGTSWGPIFAVWVDIDQIEKLNYDNMVPVPTNNVLDVKIKEMKF